MRLTTIFFLLSAVIAAFPQQKRSITEKDLFLFNWIGDPQISPNGSRVVFVKVTVNNKKDGYDTSLWSVPIDGGENPLRLTSGNQDSSPRWSPDGKWLAFIRTPEPHAGQSAAVAEAGAHPAAPQLYLLPLNGGESWRITDLPKGVSSPVWSPDSQTIAFISTTNLQDLAKQRRDKAAETLSTSNEPEHESDVRVITRAVYRFDGTGYLDPTHPEHIWVVAVPGSSDRTEQPKQLTNGEFGEGDPIWARDGAQIYFTTTRAREPYYELPHTDVYSVRPTGSEPVKLLTIYLGLFAGWEPLTLSLSPDGKRVAFCASVNEPVQMYTEAGLWVVDLAPGAKPRNLTAGYDLDMCSRILGDQGTPRAEGSDEVIWSPDGKSLFAVTTREGTANLVQVDTASGKVAEITHGNQAVEHYRATSDGSRFVLLISTATNIDDLFTVTRSGSRAQITHVNDELFSQLNLPPPEEIWYKSFDGQRIEAWIQKPPDFDPAKKYPLILNIHGGPQIAYGYIFNHEIQWMAAKGYVVLYPNPRGSTSYGQQFSNIVQYHFPGDDYRDLMQGVDEVLKRGYVNPKKLGVTGGSGGGVLTDWVIGHTDRFAAAVSQRDVAGWAAWWYIADFTLFQPSWFKAPPFEDPPDYVAHSPITYIQNVKTPLMLVLGDADYRTPPASGGEEMFRALKFLKRPVVMVRFPGESHELSRSGQPWHRIERLQHIVGWFDKYLMDMKKPEYDDVTSSDSVKPSETLEKPRTP